MHEQRVMWSAVWLYGPYSTSGIRLFMWGCTNQEHAGRRITGLQSNTVESIFYVITLYLRVYRRIMISCNDVIFTQSQEIVLLVAQFREKTPYMYDSKVFSSDNMGKISLAGWAETQIWVLWSQRSDYLTGTDSEQGGLKFEPLISKNQTLSRVDSDWVLGSQILREGWTQIWFALQ